MPAASITEAIALCFICVVFTALGSIIPFIDVLLKKHSISFQLTKSKIFWAASLAFSAGIMLFMALSSLWMEGLALLEPATQEKRFIIATTAFTIGALIIMSINKVISKLSPSFRCKCHSVSSSPSNSPTLAIRKHDVEGGVNDISSDATFTESHSDCHNKEQDVQNVVTVHTQSLNILGWQTALALALHHIPEGIAIFSAARIDFYSGFLIAFGLGLHYLPEAMTVVLPLYLASSAASRDKASFGAAWRPVLITVFITGFACPLGGLMAWLFYLSGVNDLTAGLIMTGTAGLLTWITVDGLLITAAKIDNRNRVVSKAVFIGIIVMAFTDSLLELIK